MFIVGGPGVYTQEAGFSQPPPGLALAREPCGIFTLVGHAAYRGSVQRLATIFIQLDAAGP